MNQLTCPACQRTQIETAICPNCETDLTALRILANLPPAESGRDYRWIAVGILATIFGYIVAKLQP